MYVKIQAFDNKSKCWIDVDANYPINFTNALDMNFDSGSFVTVNAECPQAYTKVRIFVGDEQGSADNFYFYATAGEQWKPNGTKKCEWRLIEPSKALQGCFIDGIAFTKNKENEKSLFYIIDRVLKVTPLRKKNQGQKYYLTDDVNVLSVLQKTKSPQYAWSSQTSLWEVLCDIGAYIDAIPRLTCNESTDEFNVITFDFINKFGATVDIPYNSRLIDVDEEQYCSELETNVQNLTVADEEEGSIVFPCPNGFITPRTNDVKLTDSCCQLLLDKDIAEIEKLYIDASKILIKMKPKKLSANLENVVDDGVAIDMSLKELFECKNKENPEVVDVTNRLFDSEVWHTLLLASSNRDTKFCKETTMYYNRYSNVIELPNNKFKGVSDVFYTNRWKMILNAILHDCLEQYFSENIDKTNFDEYKFEIVKDGKIQNYFLEKLDGYYYDFTNSLDLRQIGFRVVYKPIDRQVKLKIGKSVKTDFSFVQPYNQRSEINAATPYGRNMQGVVNRMGVESMTLTAVAERWRDVKNVGSVMKYNGSNFIVTTVNISITSNQTIKVVYYLSKNWNMLSQYFSVDKKFTNWNIPADSILRNLHYNDKCLISAEAPAVTENRSSLTSDGIKVFMSRLSRDNYAYSEVNNMQIESLNNGNIIYNNIGNDNESEPANNITSASSFGFGNNVVFTASMKDNVSAGMKLKNSERIKANNDNEKANNDDNLESYMECEDSFYTDLNGELETANVSFGGTVSKCFSELWPNVKDGDNFLQSTNTYVKLKDLVVYKDPGETLSMTYQLSAETADANIIVGNAFISGNPLCRQPDIQKQFKIWRLTKHISPLAFTVRDYGEVLQNANFSTEVLGGYAKLCVKGCQGGGWAISDENDKLLLACNADMQTLYFTFLTENMTAAVETKVKVTYVLQSTSGKFYHSFEASVLKGSYYELNYIDKIPQHYKVHGIFIDDRPAESEIIIPMHDVSVRIMLQFVPYINEIRVDEMLHSGSNTIKGLKSGAETIVQFPSDENSALLHKTWSYFESIENVVHVERYFTAVVYYRKMYDSNNEVQPVFGLAEIGDKWTIPQNSEYTKRGGTVSQNLMLNNPEVEVAVTVEDDKLKIDIKAEQVTDGKNNWIYSYSKFRVEKIIQKIETE